MPDYTIEMTYHLPISRKRTYSADTAETAYHAAIKDDDWDGARNDYETPGELMSPVSGKERMPPIAVRRFPPLHSFAK